ncbi:hypothetical protein C5167_000069 [Papaver somniferum]|uniref:RRM domain-containing protein n=1 Tax=Papaver somniferum TaxID=3469 RepID=A0A4Y7KR28_PAPSO|nr:hypothetical protein C5167_000069 [Papaver somniferum]
MRRGYSPQCYSPPRRGYGGGDRGRSPPPPRRGYGGGGGGRGGGYGGRKDSNNGSLLVRNIPMNCREPRGFAFVQFVDPYDAGEAQYHMNGQLFCGREITVVVAAETRKRPEEMRHRGRPTRFVRYIYTCGSYQMPYKLYLSGFCVDASSFLFAEGLQVMEVVEDDLIMGVPVLAQCLAHAPLAIHLGQEADVAQDQTLLLQDGELIILKPVYAADEDGPRAEWRSPGRASRSPSGSRSRSADLSPRRNR